MREDLDMTNICDVVKYFQAMLIKMGKKNEERTLDLSRSALHDSEPEIFREGALVT